MSYSFGMFFKSIPSFPTAMVYAQKYVKALAAPEHIREILECELYYFPSVRFSTICTDRAQHLKNIADDYAARDFLRLDFVYFPKAKLLALCGYNYPLTKEFFKLHVGFQNSTDQDYERKSWKGIKFFERIFDECMSLTIKDFSDEFDENEVAPEDAEKWLDYYRRDEAYSRIFKALDLDNWLWGKPDNENYQRFSLSVVTTSEERNQLYSLVTQITKTI